MRRYGCASAPGRFREPDLVLLLDVNDPRNQNAFWLGADLVVEIVSPDDVERDTVIKRADYAEAGIPAVLDRQPSRGNITVLKLERWRCTQPTVYSAGCEQPHRVLSSRLYRECRCGL